MKRRIVAFILIFAMVCSLIGCTQPSDEFQPGDTAATTEATAPSVTEAPRLSGYDSARAAVDAASELSLQITAKKTITIGGESFTEETKQALHYSGLGTDNVMVFSKENIRYNKDYTITLTEIYADGTAYVSVDDEEFFSGSIPAEEVQSRYLPPALLDESLYGTITVDGDLVSFSAPAAAETWAMPEGAELVDASGTALLNPAGELEKMTYTITYRYGPAEITLQVESDVHIEPITVEVPADTSVYIELEHVDSLRIVHSGIGLLLEAETAGLSHMESVMCQAAGVVRNQSSTMTVYSGEDLMKAETSIYLMDYSTNQSQSLDQEELYRDGKYTLSVDGGEPEEQTGITGQWVNAYISTMKLGYIALFDFWQDARATDLGSLYLIELTFAEDLGDLMQDTICQTLFNNADMLNDLASGYTTNETTGYVAIDKYTGLPTAAGYYYEGAHTIQGDDYVLSLQVDQSIEAPCVSAYYTITEEMLPEEEPENKATPLFYHVTGENGQEMWLLGTIHVGDERTAYLPQEIYDAFAASDALALEINSKAFDEQLEEDDDLQDQISDAYYYSDGTTLEGLMEEDAYAAAVQYMKATGSYNMNSPYLKPSIWSQSIDNFYLRQGYTLHGNQGVEERLHKWAEDLDKEIREVESSMFQIQMMTGYSDELQLLLLEESLASTAEEYWDGVMDLYEKWCAGDESALRETINEDVDTSELTEEELAEYEAQKPLIEEYNKAMSYDRNDGMLEKAIEYLESGETIFYAVGLAHLLDNTNGLVDTLRDAGYTVELVTYK